MFALLHLMAVTLSYPSFFFCGKSALFFLSANREFLAVIECFTFTEQFELVRITACFDNDGERGRGGGQDK